MYSHALEAFVDRLSSRTPLTRVEQAAFLNLPAETEKVERDQIIVERERLTQHVCVVASGILARTSHTKEGGRQITSFHLPGDMPDLDTLTRPRPTFGVCALCDGEIIRVSHSNLREAAGKYPAIAEALWRETVREIDIAAEWLVSLGRRTGPARVAHLFCELAVRTGTAQPKNTLFTFPVTQATIADATGLSAVHVNRSLQCLRKASLLQFERGEVAIPNWKGLADVAGFDDAYLDMEQSIRFVAPQDDRYHQRLEAPQLSPQPPEL